MSRGNCLLVVRTGRVTIFVPAILALCQVVPSQVATAGPPNPYRSGSGGATYLDNPGLICEGGSLTLSDVQPSGRRVYNLTQDKWYTTVQEAIDAAVDGNEIVLNAGTYTGIGNRDIDFKGKAITVRSTDPGDPAVIAATVIDCQGSAADPHRGFYFHNAENSASVLKGLTITNGYAPVETVDGARVWAGGGICCLGASPTIRSCTVSASAAVGRPDEAAYGGGLYSHAGSPLIDGCTVADNRVTNSSSEPLLYSLELTARGGGVCCLGGAATIRGCTIKGKTTYGGCSNWYIVPKGQPQGGGIYCDGNTSIEESSVVGNMAESAGFYTYASGGGICCAGRTVIRNSAVDANGTTNGFDLSYAFGGGIACSGDTTVTGGRIEGNTAAQVGGGIYSADVLNVSHCTISENLARYRHVSFVGGGGGICSRGETVIDDCQIAGNSAGDGGSEGDGGGIYYDGPEGAGTVTACTIVSNTASGGAGVSGPLTVLGCTVADNSATWAGGGCYGGSISNCILWGNTAGKQDPQVTGSSVSYSCIQGWTGGGTDNIASDPRFRDADGPDDNIATWADNDYRLSYGSPCINAGDPAYTPASGETDLDGQPRLLYGRVDMGAYEFLLIGDASLDGYVNVGDLQVLVAAWASQRNPPSSDWDPNCDFNSDGYINVGDLQLLVENWGRSL